MPDSGKVSNVVLSGGEGEIIPTKLQRGEPSSSLAATLSGMHLLLYVLG